MDTEKIKKQITELLVLTGLDFDIVSVKFNEKENSFYCDVTAQDLLVFSNKQADFTSAINHIAKRILDKELSGAFVDPERIRLIIDINGQHKKRVQNIEAIAHMMAERARYFKNTVEVEPMSSGDRKIVHEFLQSAVDLNTESVGDGFTRRVVIKYIGI